MSEIDKIPVNLSQNVLQTIWQTNKIDGKKLSSFLI